MERNLDLNSDQFDYVVVGGGCIAASTVLEIKRRWPDTRVAWYTGTHEYTASNDFLKIIRDAYPDHTMAEWAKQSLAIWSSDPLYSDHFHHTAWIQAIDSETKKTMNKGQDDQMVTVKTMMDRVGSTVEPFLTATEELYLNPNVGYADSDAALRAVFNRAVELGVLRFKENIARLVVEAGKCVGVEVGQGFVGAETIIVSAGAWTPSLMERSKIAIPPSFFQVTAVGVAVLQLQDSEFDPLKTMPILVTKDGEVMLSKLHRRLKVTTTETFKIGHPDELSNEVDITPNRNILEKMLPQFKGRDLVRFCCPDLITPDQYPLVDRVGGVSNLILATGGSYHSYKLMTVIGAIVALLISGEESGDPLERTIQERCRWKRSRDTIPVHPNIVPEAVESSYANGLAPHP